MIICFTEKPGKPVASPGTHRNEFPTRYSLAGCSPAAPASASLAVLILQPSVQPVQENPANGKCLNFLLFQERAQSRIMPIIGAGNVTNLGTGPHLILHHQRPCLSETVATYRHEWISRLERRPRQCPACHQARWDIPSGAVRQGRPPGITNPKKRAKAPK